MQYYLLLCRETTWYSAIWFLLGRCFAWVLESVSFCYLLFAVSPSVRRCEFKKATLSGVCKLRLWGGEAVRDGEAQTAQFGCRSEVWSRMQRRLAASSSFSLGVLPGCSFSKPESSQRNLSAPGAPSLPIVSLWGSRRSRIGQDIKESYSGDEEAHLSVLQGAGFPQESSSNMKRQLCLDSLDHLFISRATKWTSWEIPVSER